VNGLGDMESLRSESIQGLSIITAVFKEGTDVFRARQMLAEKLAETAGGLPVGVKTPRMTPLTSSTMDLLKIGLVSDKMSPMELRTFADWTLKPRLLSVPGVAKCSTFGGDVRQLQIQVCRSACWLMTWRSPTCWRWRVWRRPSWERALWKRATSGLRSRPKGKRSPRGFGRSGGRAYEWI